jgi:hypothetical protein
VAVETEHLETDTLQVPVEEMVAGVVAPVVAQQSMDKVGLIQITVEMAMPE